MSLSISNPSLANLAPDAEQLVPITFLVILLTVAGYGVTAAPLARRLGLADANPQGVLFAGADHWIRDLAKTLQNNGFSVVLVDTNYSHISEAKMMGLNAYCASILSDFVREEMDLPGVGYFAALTRNDEVNELGVNEFAHTFSLKNVFRLPLNDATKGRRATLGGKTRGRQLFKGDWNEKKIWQAYQTGWRCKLTKLTSEFTFQDFEETYGKDYLLIAVIDANRNLTLVTKDSNLQLTAGKSLICLSMPNKQV